MQGTAAPQATELQEVYQLPVMTIPPNAPSLRKDHGPRMFIAKRHLEEPDTDRECVGPVYRDESGRRYKSRFFWDDASQPGPPQWRCMLEHTKFGQLVAEIHSSYVKGQPVLVGTSTVEESIEVFELLLYCRDGAKKKQPVFKPQHVRVLNATPELAAKEAAIIAEVPTG